MLEFEDLYEILQIHPSAHPDVIRAAHGQLTQLYDPNRNPYPNAGEMLDAVDHAHDVLSDPARRAVYDQYRKARTQDRDVVQARSFQVVDNDGNVRAELGCHVIEYRDALDRDRLETQPILELRDSKGHTQFSVSLNYFDDPRLVMGDEEEDDRFSLSVDNSGETQLLVRDGGGTVELGSGILVVQDGKGATRLQAGLYGGDEGDSPGLVLRDKAGRARLEIELVEVELDQTVAQVGDDYELGPLVIANPPRLRIRDAGRNVRLELGLFGTESADTPKLSVLDSEEKPRLEIGLSEDNPWVVMKDKDGIDRLEVELVEVEIDGRHDYVPQVLVRDEDENIRFETGVP